MSNESLRYYTVEGAYVTPFERGRLAMDEGPGRWVRGAVHQADGKLVGISQRPWSGDASDPVAANPFRAAPRRRSFRLRGGWIYAGYWSSHFGHFLMETLPMFWPIVVGESADFDGIVAHRSARGRILAADARGNSRVPPVIELSSWQRDLLEMLGASSFQTRLIDGVGVVVDRLAVPERPVVLKRYVRPEAVRVWEKIAGSCEPKSEGAKIYLSRTKFNSQVPGRARSESEWDMYLDDSFSAAGYSVISPEVLPIRSQIALIRGASVVAGQSGSALHLTAFARPGTKVLSIGDKRVPRRPTHNQRILDDAVGNQMFFAPHGDKAALRDELSRIAR